MENVSQYSHLGHIITNRLDDSEDIYSRRWNLIGQINSILCYFRILILLQSQIDEMLLFQYVWLCTVAF